MPIGSATVYIALFSLATLVVALAGVMWLIRKEPGQRIFWRDLGLVFIFAFYIPGIIFYFKEDLSLWWLAVPALLLFLSFRRLLAALSWKSVSLTSITPHPTQPSKKPEFKIVHLSDLHLCVATTMEGNLAREAVIEANRKALEWARQQRPDLIAITGDITDTGARAEWEIFESLLNELPAEWHGRVAFIPGNHDLTIQQRRVSAENDGKTLLDYEERCVAFVRSFFSYMPPDAKVLLTKIPLTESLEVDLGSLYANVSHALDMHVAHPPRTQTSGEIWRGLQDLPGKLAHSWREGWKVRARKEDLGWREALDRYVPEIVFPDELRATFQPEGFWPTLKYPLVQDLLQAALYPLILFENDRTMVVALNSNTVRSSWLVDGALGEIGVRQAMRLELMLRQRPKDKLVVLLLHHHIGCPRDVRHRIARTRVELKALQLHDGWQLADILQRHGAPCVLLHGHKHAGYWARAGKFSVLSAASVPYGNKLHGDNCNAVAIDERGDVSLYASTKIACGAT